MDKPLEPEKTKMNELKEQLEAGSYKIDNKAVASAILRSPLLQALLRPA